MRRSSLLLLVVLFLTSLAINPAHGQGSQAPNVIPRVVDLTPEGGEELQPNGGVTFYFNTPMDRASVEAALVVQPANDGRQIINGKLTWQDDRTALFTPAAALRRATDYLFSFKSGAKSASGNPLQAGASFRVRTLGTLDVTQVIPAAGSKDVDADAVITVIFNRPVVPITPLSEQSKLPNPVTLTPAVTGQGIWINTSTFQFKPDRPLNGGANYTVTVRKGLTDVTGATLAEDVKISFGTVAPRAIEVRPGDKATLIARDTDIAVAFSQPMDRASTEKAFALTGPGGGKAEGKFTWREDDRSFTFQPSLLDYGALYDISVDAAVAKAATGGAISGSVKSSFTTAGLPEIREVEPKNNADTATPAINVTFNQPMKLEEFEKYLIIEPKPAQIDYNYDEYSNTAFSALLAVEDKTTYTVTIDPKGFVDKYGTPLRVPSNPEQYTVTPDGKIQFKFTIRLNFRPEANLQTNGPVGMYSAYNPTTRVYSTHRNVGQLDLELFRLTEQQAIPFLSNFVYEDLRKFVPPESQYLRAWNVAVENPPQVFRYDLLDISAQGAAAPPPAAFTCPGAPPTRLRVGGFGLVTKEPPTPSNLRAQPSTSGNILIRIPAGTSFPVQAGPRCADGYVWYQTIYNGVTGWLAEGQTGKYFVEPEGTASTPDPVGRPTVAPGTGKEPLPPGLYLLRLSSPDLPKDTEALRHVMIVATSAVNLKMHGRGASAWVTDLKTGLPVSGVTVRFLSSTSKYTEKGLERTPSTEIGKATTDANGIATVTYPVIENMYDVTLTAIAQDEKNFGISANTLTGGIEPYNYNLIPEYTTSTATIYLYSDRSLYKPGQPVYFKGVLRGKDDVKYDLYTQAQTLPVEVFNDAGESIYKTDAKVNEFGSFSGEFTLDGKAALGSYRITAKLAQPGKVNDKGEPLFTEFNRYISVAEYRTPEFRVDVVAPKPEVVVGEKIQVEVNSSYFFGGALGNAQVNWTAQAQDFYFDYAGSGAYNFVDYSEDAGPGEDFGFNAQVGSGQGVTDASGKFIIELPADLGKTKTSKEYIIEAQISDESKQIVAGRAVVVIHAGEFYLGAAPENYVVSAGEESKFNVISVDWESQAVPNVDVNVRAVERAWRSVKEVAPDTGKTVWTYQVEEKPVAEGAVKTGADGKTQYAFKPSKGGVYKLYFTTRDAKGNQITTSAYVYVAGPEYIPWRQRNNYGFDLKADKADYKVGDTASLLIASPFQGAAKAWITVERGGIIKSEVIDLTTNSTVYKLPIDAGFAPNIFVSVLIVKGVDDKNPVAAFRLGYAQLNVDAERYKLNIDVTPDKEKAGPREEVTYTLKVTDYQGKPVKAEVGVGLTDLAVLSLLPDTSTPILDHFYNTQGLSVRTASTLTISVDEQTQSILNTVKGGGGGGRESGVLQIRQLFVDTPLWSPTVTTDENGTASVKVTLPDQLTTWRLDARAFTLPTGELNTTLVGQVTTDLLSTKPLIVRPLTPRFFIAGDKSTLAATINNNTGADQDVTVKITVKGAALDGTNSVKLSIRNNERGRADFPIIVPEGGGGVEVVFSAETADAKFNDAAKPNIGRDGLIPVYRYESPESVSTSGVIDAAGGDRLEGIVLPRELNISQGDLRVRIDPSLSIGMIDALRAVNNATYDCTEATASRLLTNAATVRALNTLKISNDALKTEIDTSVDLALQRLYSQQHVDGGWGWCVRDYSTTHVTSYAVLALIEARNSGYTIDEDTLTRAISYLNQNLAQLGNQPPAYLLNREAFVLYVLAKAGAGNVSRTVAIYGIRERLNIFARAHLLAALHILTPTDTAKINTLISDLQNTAITSASGQHWEERIPDRFNWNTDTRTTAVVLTVLSEVQPKNALLPQVVRWLMYNRENDTWETVQETAWAVFGLTNWMVISGDANPAYTFSAQINDKPLIEPINTASRPDAATTPAKGAITAADLAKDGTTNNLLITRSAGDGTLYYSATLTAYLPVSQIKAVSKGITVSRQYSLAGDRENKPITSAKVGDSIRVTVTLTVPEDMPYVTVTDPIPAGTESLDPNLATTGGVGVQPQLQFKNPFAGGYGWWWFGDTQLRDEQTILSAEYLPRGTYTFTYVVRAGLAGTYNVIPTTAQQVYFPEVYGRSDAAVFTITP
jgi:alpha-2-macroglobulin